jgi:protein-tyrosine-phosphatase
MWPGVMVFRWTITWAQADAQLAAKSDLILVMEPEHLRFIAAMAPENRGNRCYLDNGWRQRIFPIPTAKAVKLSNMFSGSWEKPVRNGLVV